LFIEYSDIEKEYLKSVDSSLAKVIERFGHIYREMETDLFSSVVRHIIGQQISTAAQETIYKKLILKVGSLNSQTIDSLTLNELQSIGITFRKANYIKSFASKVINGIFNIEELNEKDDQEVIKELTSLDGVGLWTAEMIMIFALGRKDVISYGDLAIRRGMEKLYNKDKLNKESFNFYKKLYSSYATIASLYIWAYSRT